MYFTFHIPAEEFEQTLKEGPIWKLGSVGVGSAVDTGDHDRPEDVLLKTKLLTQPGHTRNPELRARASSHPQMKEVQCTCLYLRLCFCVLCLHNCVCLLLNMLL